MIVKAVLIALAVIYLGGCCFLGALLRRFGDEQTAVDDDGDWAAEVRADLERLP